MFRSMLEGIFRCNGCGRTYSEYVNGCVEDHGPPRSVELAIPEQDSATYDGDD